MSKRTVNYPHLKFRKKKEKWGEVYWICYCQRHQYLRGLLRKYEGIKRWYFKPSVHLLFPAEFCHDLGNFLDELNKDKDNE